MFNINNFTKKASNTRYDRRISHLLSDKKYVENIKEAVGGAIKNINNDIRSFVIYGEPQSGKTEMMIALTAKLLDSGFKIVIVLLNDSVQLLDQNLDRFKRSGIDPAPKKFSEILDPNVKIVNGEWIIFSKKNGQDLKKLISKIRPIGRRVIIDDEADYATPNSKINTEEKTRINELTEELLGNDGIYIGVTATPARLDLNNTHQNVNERWVDFPPHPSYKGQDTFFPTPVNNLEYHLNLLPDEGDDPKHLREALFSFVVNVAHLNLKINDVERYYSMLIHTSGIKVEHKEDYEQVVKIFEGMKNENENNFEKYYKRIFEIASERYPGEEQEITQYIMEHKNRHSIVVMNSDKEQSVLDNNSATSPSTLFTIVIGGNIVSRGVTFDNLLSMFFTRDVKHKIQQDTYIQRARMFGSRGDYLKYFELSIPSKLYLDWHKCFIFHRLSLESRRTGNDIPVWLEDVRIAAVSSRSIDKTTVSLDRGEMSFEIFDYTEEVDEILSSNISNSEKLKSLSRKLGHARLPEYLLNYIFNFSPEGDRSIAIHEPRSIAGYKDADQDQIKRVRGFIGDRDLEKNKYPHVIHHFEILHNAQKQARIFYKYEGSIRFIKNSKRE